VRARYWFTACLLLGAVSAGCSNSPASPTPVSNDTLIIQGVRPLDEGDTIALTVSVRVPSGAFKAVAEDAAVTWSSSNTAVATVSGRGVVTALQKGSTSITASLAHLSATVNLAITSNSRTYTGYVQRVPDQIPVPGATVAAVDAKGGTQSVGADGIGRFSIRLPRGLTRFTVTAPGYETAEISIDTSTSGDLLFLSVPPIGFGVREQFGVTWADWHGPIPGLPARQVIIPIIVHQPGTIRMLADVCVGRCSASEAALVCVEIRDSRNNVVSSARGGYDQLPVIPSVQTMGGGERYEIKVGVCSAYPDDLMRRFYIDLTHPK